MIGTSVIICTHNPRREYLGRVLAALEQQTLPKNQWELLLVDNASELPLSETWDLSWHPNARHIREDELGLTPARLRGMREGAGNLLVFVDDDNLLAEDYLEVAWNIHQQHPRLAAIGGSIAPEYEASPPPWFHPYRQMIAIREVDDDRWSNNPDDFGSTPIGAGMIITKMLANHYSAASAGNSLKLSLDRKGGQLTGGGDVDIALTACDMGFGKGVFSALKLTHIIPAGRTDLDYLLRLQEGTSLSVAIRKHLRGQGIQEAAKERRGMMKVAKCLVDWIRYRRLTPIQRAFDDSWKRGLVEAAKVIG